MNKALHLSGLAALLLVLGLAAGCASNKPGPNQIFLMPAPEVYEEGQVDPFIDNDPISRGVQPGILFATDRQPAAADDSAYEHYTHHRGGVLRLDLAPDERGLLMREDMPVWIFPEIYVNALRSALARVNPALKIEPQDAVSE